MQYLPKIAIHIIRMLLQNIFVQLLSLIEGAERLAEARLIIGGGDRDGIVVLRVLLCLPSGPFQGLLQILFCFLQVA